MLILKIHTLKKGWHDRDHLLLHAAFQLLVDFIEREKPGKIVDWSADGEHRRAWKEIRSLYHWWTQTRPRRKDPLDAKGLKRPPMRREKIAGSDHRRLVPFDRKKYRAYDAALSKSARLEKAWQEEDQRSLHRLIEIRLYLWT